VERIDVAVIGAGPFGLSAGAHLSPHRKVRVFGQPMQTWRTLMPQDMLLRSDWAHTNLSAPGDAGLLDRFVAATGEPRVEPTPLQLFLRYGEWFRSRFVPDCDPADVVQVERDGGGYRVTTSAGGEADAARVVVAVGVIPFPNVPEAFRGIDDARVGFAVERRDPALVRGKRVVVIGAGQNGLESAVMARRAGAASVEIVVRSQLRWYTPHEPYTARGPVQARLHRLAYPVVGFGPPPINRIVLHPQHFARLPAGVRAKLNRRLLRAGGAPWIRDEVDGAVPVREGCTVERVLAEPAAVRLELSSGDTIEADLVILAVGYRFDLDRLRFLAPELRRRIAVRDGWPVLDDGMRSSERSLHFAGYPAEGRFGPLSRFVEGTRFASQRIASALV
jgi:cation diffusion facilitator CzcD-associated flavoprotein CzcO